MPYPGGAGDSLIQFATARLLRNLNIRTSVDPNDADIVLVPGGNPTMWHSIGIERWLSLWRRYPDKEFVVGPAGFREGYSDWAGPMKREGAAVSALFARDPKSLRNLNAARLRSDIRIALSHDPALSLRGSDWLAAHKRASSEEYDLLAFRNDHETNLRFTRLFKLLRSTLPGRIYQPMMRFNAATVQSSKVKRARRFAGDDVFVNDVSRQRLEVCVEAVRAARTVHTDRLHTMLLAAMLEKKVFAYPTSHAKLEDIYNHSLKDWADVDLVD